MIGITIFTESHKELAEEAIRRFKKHTGLSVIVIHLNEKRTNNYLRKLHIFKYVDGSAVYFDADWWMVKDFDFSQFEGSDKFFGVVDPGGDYEKCFVYKDCETHNLDISRYINTGFFIFNRKHHSGVFESAIQNSRRYKVSDFGEQTYLNMAIQSDSVILELLDKKFNYLFKRETNLIKGVYAFHGAAMPLESKLTELRRITK